MTTRKRTYNGGLGGIEYSGAEYWIKVVITKDDATASLVTESVTYYTDAALTQEASQVTFTNRYTVGGTSFTPEASKTLVGKNMAEGEFRFEAVELDPENGYAPFTVTVGGVTTEKIAATGSNAAAADGNAAAITFSPIPYNEIGSKVYYYKLHELAGSSSGISYDSTVYYLKVTVTDDGEGNLTAQGQYYAGATPAAAFASQAINAVDFVNHYGPGTASLELHVEKAFQTITGKAYNYVLVGSEFDFHVYAYDPATAAIGALVTSGTNGASVNGIAPVSFGSMVYTREDVYAPGQVTNAPASKAFTYVILEEAPRNAREMGIQIDTAKIFVTVTVTDDGYGNLAIATRYTDEQGSSLQRFTNTYNPSPAAISIPVEKLLRNKKLTASDVFTFILDNGSSQLTAQNGADGKAVFALEYGPADMTGAVREDGVLTKVFTYTLYESEVMPANANGSYTRDEAVYNITVTVTDNGSGKLMATAVFEKNGNKVTAIQFDNSYTPNALTQELSVQIGAQKSVVNHKGQPLADRLAGFTFQITDISGNVISTGRSQADGHIPFDAFTFDAAGEYHYWISEVDAGDNGYTYDANRWEVHIAVSYDTSSGKLYIAPDGIVCACVTDPTVESDKPVFVNVYQPLPTGITILAEKVLEGRPLNAGEFTFHLLKDGLFWAEAHNGADGIIRFPVTFTEEGTYNFVIQEQVPEKTLHGVTYNTTAYPVSTIVVTDENGQLKATVNDNAVDNTNVGSGAVIVNKYVAADTTVTVKAFKAMIGRELNDSEFTFYLKDAGGKTVATGTNDAEGHITFDTITYKHGDLLGQESRVFTYTLSEEAGTLPGVSYDTTTHTVEVTLRDDLHGQLHAQVAYSGELLFTNTYTPADTTLVLEAAKKLFGRQLAEGEFTFELLNDQGQQLATATNKADGSVRFDAISFYEAGQYTFTLKEIPGSDEDIRYDENSYTVTVNVSDEDGQLVATASYPKGGVVFKNTYTPPVVPGNPVTGDETPVMLLAFMLAASSTALLTMAVQRLRKRKTQA